MFRNLHAVCGLMKIILYSAGLHLFTAIPKMMAALACDGRLTEETMTDKLESGPLKETSPAGRIL
jgi:hypothetical protein